MSNPLKEMQLSVDKHFTIDKHKPIKIKSIIFDRDKGQIREVERGYSIIEQQTAQSDLAGSPLQRSQSKRKTSAANNYQFSAS